MPPGLLLVGGKVALQIILADNQAIFRTGMARVLANEADMRLAAQCADVERLKEAVGSLRQSIVVYPSSICADLHSIIEWIEQASSRSIVVVEHGTTLDDSVADRIEGQVLRSVAGPQLVDCIRRIALGE